MSHLQLLDLLVIAGYFMVLFCIGYWAARREKQVSANLGQSGLFDRFGLSSAGIGFIS